MQIAVQPVPGSSSVTCVSIDGRIDAYTVGRVEEELNSLIRIGSSKLICDLSGVEFVSSAGFKAFRRILGFAREQGGDLKFCKLSAEMGGLFGSVGFAKETRAFPTLEEALADFDSEESSAQNQNGQTEPGRLANSVKAIRRIIGLGGEDESPKQVPAKSSSRKADASLRQTQILPKDSSLKETVIFSSPGTPSNDGKSSQRGEDNRDESKRFALFEPVKVALYPEPAHFQNLSQLLGTVGSLVGFPSMGLVKLNVAVLELCRSMVCELNPDETFTIEIDSLSPGFRVFVDIPRQNYDVYRNLQPKQSDKMLSEKEGKEWLLNYVDEVDFTTSREGTRLRLSLRA